jgi:hypothetical protein
MAVSISFKPIKQNNMSMEKPSFDPNDPKYKTVKDLPENKHIKFGSVNYGGSETHKEGFVQNSAILNVAKNELKASAKNTLNILTRKKEVTGEELRMGEAKKEDIERSKEKK